MLKELETWSQSAQLARDQGQPLTSVCSVYSSLEMECVISLASIPTPTPIRLEEMQAFFLEGGCKAVRFGVGGTLLVTGV